jgi:hypothetical protein
MVTHALDRAGARRHRRGRRLLARLRGPTLDAALASGADPATSAGLAARVAQLSQRRRVLAVADGLERTVERAAQPQPEITAAAPVLEAEVLASRDQLLTLAAALRTTPQPPPRALALCRRLVSDGTSPLHDPHADGTLQGAVHEALHAFEAGHTTNPPTV